MGASQELTSATVDAVSLDRALQDAEAANRRAMELTKELLEREDRIAALEAQLADLKRMMDPRRKVEHVFRSNHTLYALARRTKRMMGR